MQTKWIILDRSGKPTDWTLFADRPHDANDLIDDNPYTPWFRKEDHLHVENGRIDGIHTHDTQENAKAVLRYCLSNEKMIMDHFGAKEDNILLLDVLKFLALN